MRYLARSLFMLFKLRNGFQPRKSVNDARHSQRLLRVILMIKIEGAHCLKKFVIVLINGLNGLLGLED